MWVHPPNEVDEPKCDRRPDRKPDDATRDQQGWPSRRLGARWAEQRHPSAVENEMREIGRPHNSTNPKGRGDSKDEQNSARATAGHYPNYPTAALSVQ